MKFTFSAFAKTLSVKRTGFMALLLLCVFTAGMANAAFPQIQVNPASPEEGDSVVLWIIKGVNPDACVPSYTVTYTIETLPQEIWPPMKVVHMSYKETPPPLGMLCLMVETQYGPRLVIPDAEPGSYTVKNGDETVGTFMVRQTGIELETHTVSGIITDDPYPSKRMSMPIKGARVYLGEQLYTILEGKYQSGDIISPNGVYTDSALTDDKGAFEFKGIAPGNWALRCSAKGYVTRTVSLYLSSDTALSIALLNEGASASVAGYVSRRHENPEMSSVIPVEGCTVTVMTETQDGIYYMRASGPVEPMKDFSIEDVFIIAPVYTAITDSYGHYSIENIPIVFNGVPAAVYARASGLAPGSQSVQLYNTSSASADFDLQKSFSNSDSVEYDGVVYRIVTDKVRYAAGEYLSAKYYVENTSGETVTFSGSGAGQNLCTYALEMFCDNETVFSTNNGLMCPLIMRQWELAPGEMDSMIFDPYILEEPYGLLTVSALMNMDEKTRASVAVEVFDQTGAKRGNLTAGVKTINSLIANRDGKISLSIASPQKVTIAAYRPDGRRIALFASGRYLSAGVHEFTLSNKLSWNGLILIRAQGDKCLLTQKVFSGHGK